MYFHPLLRRLSGWNRKSETPSWPRSILMAMALLAGTSTAQTAMPSSSPQALALAKEFEFFCLDGLPTYETVRSKAERRGLQQIFHRDLEASWRLPGAGDESELSISGSAQSQAVGCAISVRGDIREQLKGVLSQSPKLGRPDVLGGERIQWSITLANQLAWVRVSKDRLRGGTLVSLIWHPEPMKNQVQPCQ